ncbi:MAG: insulinase family protein, partial [Firmicutes bacterium]|nr:insulinase family protein [Bacillota bacterium]
SKLQMGYATGVTLQDERYPALMMYAGILGGFPHSKLFMNVRERAGLAYYAYAHIDSALGLMTISAGINRPQYAQARAIIEEQLEAMRQGEISAEEIMFTQAAFRNEILSEEDGPDGLISRQVQRMLLGGGLSGPELMARLTAVRVEDIVTVGEQIALDTVFLLAGTSGDEAEEADG